MHEVDLIHYPERRKHPTIDETIARMTYIKDEMLDTLEKIRNLKTEFPVNREVWDSLSTITNYFETCIVELDLCIGGFKQVHGKE